MNTLASEAVAPATEARFSFGVVDAFFVRAADDAVGDDYGLGSVLFEEGDDLLAHSGVGAHVHALGEPTFERSRLVALVAHDADDHLRSSSAMGLKLASATPDAGIPLGTGFASLAFLASWLFIKLRVFSGPAR
jgi:hypothetical protein